MAPFAFDPLDEEEKQKTQDQQAGNGAPEMTGGGSTFGSGGTAPQAPQQKGTNTQGSGFVSLDKYMNANKGNNFGGQFTGKVQGTLDQAKQGLQSNAQGFQNASNQGTTRWNDVQNQVQGIVDNAGDQTTADDAKKIQGLSKATYQGPEDFNGSAYGTQAQGGVTKAAQQAGAAGTEGGRFALLDQFFGRPNYSMGEKSLDNLLVQNAPGTGARAQALGGQAKQLSNQFNAQSQDLNNLANANKQATLDTGNQTRNYLTNAESGFGTDLNNRYQDYLKGNADYNQARLNDLSDDTLDSDTQSIYGLNPGDTLYDVNLSNYLQDNPNGSMGQFASDQDYAKYLALSQISGEDPTALLPADRAQAGTGANMGKVSVDQSQLKNDLTARGGAYTQAIAPVNQQIQDYTNRLAQRFARRNDPNDPAHDAPMGAFEAANNADRSKIAELNAQLAALQSQFGASRKVGTNAPAATVPIGVNPGRF